MQPELSLAHTRSRRLGDRAFFAVSLGAGVLIIVALGCVALFLIAESLPGLGAGSGQFKDPAATSFWQYVAPFAFGTLWAAALALTMAVPLAVGIALFISHYAPRRIAQPLGYLIDLLAAVPSVVYGLWGIEVVAPSLRPVYLWLSEQFGWVPFFAGTPSGTGRTIFTVAVVLAVMILPVMTALCREVFLQTPALREEAALALGATRWEMIRLTVLPFGRPGIISAAMLGLGRALGETMAVAMVLSPASIVSFVLISSQNPTTIAANIALNFPESSGVGINVLIATGLVLFVITFAVNFAARFVVQRLTEFQDA